MPQPSASHFDERPFDRMRAKQKRMIKNDSSLTEANKQESKWRDRDQIAEHFQVGRRTIGKWMRQKILPYSKHGAIVRFDLSLCDPAFAVFKRKLANAPFMGVAMTWPRKWKTKAQIASHFRLGYRTVGCLMARQHLPYVKIGNVVRLDLEECEALMFKPANISGDGRRHDTSEEKDSFSPKD